MEPCEALLGDLESLSLMEPLIEPRKLFLLALMLAATGLSLWRDADERRFNRLWRELFVGGWMSRSDICEGGRGLKAISTEGLDNKDVGDKGCRRLAPVE